MIIFESRKNAGEFIFNMRGKFEFIYNLENCMYLLYRMSAGIYFFIYIYIYMYVINFEILLFPLLAKFSSWTKRPHHLLIKKKKQKETPKNFYTVETNYLNGVAKSAKSGNNYLSNV